MSRARAALVLATALGAALFGVPPGPWSGAAFAIAVALVVWAVVAGRPGGWAGRTVAAFLAAYLAVWAFHAVDTWRLARPEAARRLEARALDRVATGLGTRLAEDRRVAERVAGRLAEGGLPPLDEAADAQLFAALGAAAPARLREGIGLELYDATGALRAWWGDPRGERLAPDSVSAAAHGAVTRRPVGYVLAYAGAHVPGRADTLHLVVKDIWEVETPLRREVVGEDLPLARRAREAHLVADVVPHGDDPPATGGTPIVGPDGRPVAWLVGERFLLDRVLADRRGTAERALALLLLWPLVWATGAAWHAARRLPAERLPRPRPLPPRLAAALGRGTVVGALLFFLLESRWLARLLPARWFSPVAFASTALGPAGRSPGDVLVAAALAFLLAVAIHALLRGRPAPPGRWVPIGGVALGTAVAAGAVHAASPLLEEAMQSMSPEVFFSPTLLFAPALLLVLLGFALLVGVAAVVVAIAFRLTGVPDGRAWGVSAAAGAVLAFAFAAWILPRAAMAGGRAGVAVPLTLVLLGGGWVAHAASRRGGRGGPRSPRLGLAAALTGALVVLPLAGFARVQAATELLLERGERIGRASTQWLEYTMERTVAFLSVEEAAIERAIREGNRDAALALWGRSPLRELDFATALYLFDAEGRVTSQFSLAADDLTDRARQIAAAVGTARVAVRGSQGTGAARWAVVPIQGDTARLGTAVAMTTGSVEIRDRAPSAQFVLTDLLAGAAPEPDLPGYTTLGLEETPPPRTLLTSVERGEDDRILLAMPLDPLLPAPRGYAVFAVVAALAGLALGALERAGDPVGRARWRATLAEHDPLRSFRVQLLLAILAVAAIPLAFYATVSYRATRLELEEATRSAAAEALVAASRLLTRGDALGRVDDRALGTRLREIGTVLQQDLILYWRGRTIASSRPEIFASRLFADRMPGSVYAELFAVGEPLVFDATALGERSFLIAYRALSEPGLSSGYALATPLLLREDRARVELQRLGEGVFLLSALSIAFLLAVGWVLARYMARPLSALEEGSRQIAAGRLWHRLPAPGRRDEFGRVQQAFNAMAEGLDRSQRALEREKSRVQAILASVGAGVVALDAGGRVRLLNDRAAELLERSPDEVVAREAATLAAEDGALQPFWRAVARAAATGGRGDRELVLKRAGEERHVHLVCTPLPADDPAERGMVVAFEDITDNIRSQRVLAWGEMARQVAHEIKNPLTPMKLSLQHLERTAEDRAPEFERVLHDNIALVLEEIDRLERIAGSFARFAVPDPAVRGPFDALAVARDVVALFAPGEEAIAYAIETEGEPRPLVGEEEGFRRILVNLLQNAREAVLAAPDGGRVTVRFDWAREPGRARVSVIDDGIGLPAEGVDRLFEPSFSTKTRGTGLGLAITRRIVEAWGGTIDHERRDPSGTAIHVRLAVA